MGWVILKPPMRGGIFNGYNGAVECRCWEDRTVLDLREDGLYWRAAESGKDKVVGDQLLYCCGRS
jgi:hypothetical protein